MDSPDFDTHRLDHALAHRRETNEVQRLAMLNRVKSWLIQEGARYGINDFYVFGSVTRPYRFTEKSDVDVAIEGIQPEYFFDAMASLSEAVGREVDLVDLSKCHFAERIRQRGLRCRGMS